LVNAEKLATYLQAYSLLQRKIFLTSGTRAPQTQSIGSLHA
jgi:hypothetical protein